MLVSNLCALKCKENVILFPKGTIIKDIIEINFCLFAMKIWSAKNWERKIISNPGFLKEIYADILQIEIYLLKFLRPFWMLSSARDYRNQNSLFYGMPSRVLDLRMKEFSYAVE